MQDYDILCFVLSDINHAIKKSNQKTFQFALQKHFIF